MNLWELFEGFLSPESHQGTTQAWIPYFDNKVCFMSSILVYSSGPWHVPPQDLNHFVMTCLSGNPLISIYLTWFTMMNSIIPLKYYSKYLSVLVTFSRIVCEISGSFVTQIYLLADEPGYFSSSLFYLYPYPNSCPCPCPYPPRAVFTSY